MDRSPIVKSPALSMRVLAVRALVDVEDKRRTLASAVDRSRASLGDERDRGLLLEVTSGVCRWRAAIDEVLASCSGRPIVNLDPAVRAVLRIGIYQMRYLDRIPAHAIVHDSVETIRSLGQPQAAGFVNAVLRAAQRLGDRLVLPVRPESGASIAEQTRYLSVALSHPEWLVDRWLARYGFEEAEAWCRFNNEPPDICVRVIDPQDRDRVIGAIHSAGLNARPGRWSTTAVELPPGTLGRLPADIRERFVVQDEASQIVAHTVGAEPGMSVLDLCAAPGGKTLILDDAVGPSGHVVATDFRPARVRLLRDTVASAGSRASVVSLNGRAPLPFGPVFDRVLVDAPCSGLGTLRRDPDLKWARNPKDLLLMAAEQRQFLEQAASVVRPGGRLVYSTCSSEPDENEDVVDVWLQGRSDFSRMRPRFPPQVIDGDALLDDRGQLRTSPIAHRLDAFFAAVLVRHEDA